MANGSNPGGTPPSSPKTDSSVIKPEQFVIIAAAAAVGGAVGAVIGSMIGGG